MCLSIKTKSTCLDKDLELTLYFVLLIQKKIVFLPSLHILLIPNVSGLERFLPDKFMINKTKRLKISILSRSVYNPKKEDKS